MAIFSPKHGQSEHAGTVTIVTQKRGPDDPGSAQSIASHPTSEIPTRSRKIASWWRDATRSSGWMDAGRQRKSSDCPRLDRGKGRVPRASTAAIPPPRARASFASQLVADYGDARPSERLSGSDGGCASWRDSPTACLGDASQAGQRQRKDAADEFRRHLHARTVVGHGSGGRGWFSPLRSSRRCGRSSSWRWTKSNNSVKRMHSFLTVMPGETVSCVGCHESRTQTGAESTTGQLAAMQRPPSSIAPLAGNSRSHRFPARHSAGIGSPLCEVSRVRPTRRRDRSAWRSRPRILAQLLHADGFGYVSDGRDRLITNLPPRSVGTSASPVMNLLNGSHYEATTDGSRTGSDSILDRVGGRVSGHLRGARDRNDRRISQEQVGYERCAVARFRRGRTRDPTPLQRMP